MLATAHDHVKPVHPCAAESSYAALLGKAPARRKGLFRPVNGDEWEETPVRAIRGRGRGQRRIQRASKRSKPLTAETLVALALDDADFADQGHSLGAPCSSNSS